ncbi:MAG: hypothetical protein IT442_15815 [Phycisphaeraceae bacterium]|nr:hypothetical protein [Phycisphaeraceae bacterium]
MASSLSCSHGRDELQILFIETLKIILLSVVAACLYGIVHDQVTARVCVEYFTVAHRPIFGGTQDPTLLGLGWGVIATWWVGLPLGVLLALACRLGRWPCLTARQTVVPIAVLLAFMGVVAFSMGLVGYQLGESGDFVLLGELAEKVPADRHARFIADAFAHDGSYGSGIVGGLVLSVVMVIRRWRLARRSANQLAAVPPSSP